MWFRERIIFVSRGITASGNCSTCFGCWHMYKWALFPTFQRNMMPQTSASQWVRSVFSQIQYTGWCDPPTHRRREKPVLSLNQYDHSIVTGDGSVELIHSSRISNIGCISGISCGPGFMRIEQVTVACTIFLASFAPKTSPLSDSPMTQ